MKQPLYLRPGGVAKLREDSHRGLWYDKFCDKWREGWHLKPDPGEKGSPKLAWINEIAGTPVAHLAHRSDNPHCDVFVRICDVTPDGRAVNVSDGFRRLVPGEHDADLVLPLDPCAHRFAAGHRVQVLVAGGAHPRYARNVGSGEPVADATTLVPSHRRLQHGTSRVVLPVVGR